ncbi:DUF429 domain-containing protein [soil metagenome]
MSGAGPEASDPAGRVIGIDAAGKRGWAAVLVDEAGFVDAEVGTLETVIAWAEPISVIAVDIPIGNVPGGGRRCDVEARGLIGRRSSSVFSAPPLEVLDAESYEAANEMLAAMEAPRLSKQAWALGPKIYEAAKVAVDDPRVVEVHPEVSFREMAAEPLPWSKKSWNGLLLRRRLLAEAGILLPDVVPALAGVVADDVVDAAVAAWSARRVAEGTARCVPNPPEDAAGRQVAIWY